MESLSDEPELDAFFPDDEPDVSEELLLLLAYEDESVILSSSMVDSLSPFL